MDLDDLNQIRQCLYEARNRISGKTTVAKELMLESLEESLDIVTQAILEVKNSNGG
jgi:hypothetical protein